MTTDLLAGQTQATFTGALPLLPFIKDGKLRALAVGGAKRIPSLPDVPTVAESGYPGFETSQWYGILAPAGTPETIVTKLSNEVRRILGLADVTGRLSADGFRRACDESAGVRGVHPQRAEPLGRGREEGRDQGGLSARRALRPRTGRRFIEAVAPFAGSR